MKTLWNVLRAIVKIGALAALVLCAVYFWNLDQKLLDGVYRLSRRVRGDAGAV